MSVFSPEPLEFEDQESAQELEELESFNLLLLPNEIILKIINSINERIKIGLFTSGPSNELIQFSLVNKLFYGLITPLIFKSIRFNNLSKIVGGNSNVGVRPLGFKKLRSLTNLVKILNSIKLRNYAPNLEIEELYINLKDEFDSIKFQLKELENFNLLLNLFNFTIKILFLEEIQLDLNGDKFLLSISNLTNLRVLRLNQVDFGHLKIIQNLTNFDNLKTLQIMHGSSQFLTLVRKAPKLESLLIWPESRRLASLAPFISQNLLPQLRLLSLDVVNEPTCLLLFASRIKELHAQSIPINLTELFIEGTLRSHEQELLLEALGMTRIKRLALYHIGLVEPRLIGQIAKVLPGLEALTLVQGNTQGSVLWPAPFEEYLPQLSLLTSLTHYASDRKATPPPLPMLAYSTSALLPIIMPPPTQLELEYLSFSSIGLILPNLINIVGILNDVSEGCTGYFGLFKRIDRKEGDGKGGKKVKLSLKKETVKDFLIDFDRWCL